MKVIYDEAKAMESTNRFQNAARRHTATVLIGALLSVLGLLGFGFAMSKAGETGQVWWGYAAFGSLVAAGGAVVWLSSTVQPERTSDVAYYTAAQGKKVLGAEIKPHDCCGYARDWVHLITETTDGDVEHLPICPAEYQENTKIQEPTFDAHKGVVYVPYEWWKEVPQ